MSRAGLPSPVELVGVLSEMAPTERTRHLDRVCAGHPALRAEVESLLEHLGAGDQFMERGPLAGPIIRPHLIPESPDVLPPGTVISRYRIERVLGQGGMGVVYLAQQENPRRQVALKVVRSAIASTSLLRRFQREAQLMGRLQHPGIVQIFEAGAAEIEGVRQPFLAMEYVRGVPLLKRIGERGLGVRARMELVAHVCDAVQHAHERGLVHRDLKPGNILVGEDGRPRVLDFGVARAAEPDAPGTTVATDIGQLIGTLAYMSPEQVGADPSKLDARSDVYALGVILYECLAGRPPHAVRPEALPEAVRLIREEVPARLSSVDRVLRGDVETIVGKALEKEPQRRYQSAAELAQDIRRYLAGDPIAAKQDSALYILQKRLRRYRWAVGAAAVFVALVVGFAAWSMIQARAYKELAVKEAAGQRARTLELRASDIERGRMLSRTGDSSQAESLLWRAHIQDPQSEHSLWALREHYANAPCLSTLGFDARNIRTVTFSPDGGQAILCGTEGCVEVWDLARGTISNSFSGPRATIISAQVHPAGWLIAGARTGALTVWEPQSGRRLGSLPNRATQTYLALSPDGLTVAAGGADGAIGLWSLPLMASLGSFPGHTGAVVSLAFSPDGRVLATGGVDRTVRLWDVASRAKLGEKQRRFGSVSGLSFSRDGGRIACGNSAMGACMWGLRDGSFTPFADDIGIVRSVAFLRDDAYIAAMGEFGISLFDGQTCAYIKDLGNHGEPVARIAVSPDGNRLLSLARDSLKVWDFNAAGPATWLSGHRPHTDLNIASASNDGSRIATVSSTGGVELWDRDGKFVRWLPGRSGGQYGTCFNAAGTLLAGCAQDGLVRIWDPNSSGPARELSGHNSIVNCVMFAPSGDLLASCGDDGKLRLWDGATGELKRVLQGPGPRLFRVRFSAGGDVVLASSAKQVGLWRVADGEPVPYLPLGGSEIFSLDTSPDGRTIAVGYRRRAIGLFDLATNTHLADLTGHTELPWNLAFSPDGRLLASTTSAGSIKIWDVKTRRCLASFRDDSGGWLMTVSFLPNSSSLLLGHQAHGVSIWDMNHYDRHIRGNAEMQLGRLGAELGEDAIARTRRWLGAATMPLMPLEGEGCSAPR